MQFCTVITWKGVGGNPNQRTRSVAGQNEQSCKAVCENDNYCEATELSNDGTCFLYLVRQTHVLVPGNHLFEKACPG